MIEVKNLKKVYFSGGWNGSRQFEAVKGVSFTIGEGETLGLIGESGCGKTTLAKMILRLIPATEGEIILDGENITDLSGRKLQKKRRDMQIMFQNPETALNPRMKIRQSIAEVLRLNKICKPRSLEEKEKIDELIYKVGLQKEHLSRYPHELSGGQIQRAVLARIVALSPKLLVADEPTSMLDVSVQAQILNLIKEMQKSLNCSCMFISHDLDVVRIMCDCVAVMYQGSIVELGNTEEIFSSPRNHYTKELMREFYQFS